MTTKKPTRAKAQSAALVAVPAEHAMPPSRIVRERLDEMFDRVCMAVGVLNVTICAVDALDESFERGEIRGALRAATDILDWLADDLTNHKPLKLAAGEAS